MEKRADELSDEELCSYLEVILYELDMLIGTASLCEADIPANDYIGQPITQCSARIILHSRSKPHYVSISTKK